MLERRGPQLYAPDSKARGWSRAVGLELNGTLGDVHERNSRAAKSLRLRRSWGYKPSAMLGIWVTAWTQDLAWPFPLEAAIVWVASPFAIVLTYEFVKLWKYRADPSKPTYVHPSLR